MIYDYTDLRLSFYLADVVTCAPCFGYHAVNMRFFDIFFRSIQRIFQIELSVIS